MSASNVCRWLLSVLTLYVSVTKILCSGPSSTAHYTSLKDHDSYINRLRSQIIERKGKSIVLRRATSQSHCPRSKTYKKESVNLDVSKLDAVINVEILPDGINNPAIGPYFKKYISNTLKSVENKTIGILDVQAMASMEQMVDAVLPLGLIPAVVPEFKGITIGGSIQGLAAESTSFRFGFVHDAVLGFELLLSDGTRKWCSPEENAELYYAVPGSFGSLGICTRAKVLCVSAKPFVRVTARLHPSQGACVQAMGALQDAAFSSSSPSQSPAPALDFIEGIGYASDKIVSLEGRFEGGADGRRVSRCNQWAWDWFYRQVEFALPKHHRGMDSGCEVAEFVFPTKDYLFRHDRGSFWIAATSFPELLAKYLMGPILDSSNMFLCHTLLPWVLPPSRTVLQDFMMPRATCAPFFEALQEQVDVWPVWLLPMYNHPAPRSIFASPKGLKGHICNVGAYGVPRKPYNFVPDNVKLEAILHKHGGRKVYYSHAFYPRDFFYNELYDGKRYFDLRRKYVPDGALPEIFDKIITKPGQLL